MNNNMAKKNPTHIYEQLNLKNKLSKQEEQRQNHGQRVLMVARWERVWGNGGRGERIKKYKQVVTEQPWGCKVQYRKWGNQRTYTHEPWTWTMV